MSEKISRSHLRFSPDQNTTVWFSRGEDFKKEFIGLAISEAHGGAAFVITQKIELSEGEILMVKVGEMPELKSEVRWIRNLDEDVTKVGIQYLE